MSPHCNPWCAEWDADGIAQVTAVTEKRSDSLQALGWAGTSWGCGTRGMAVALGALLPFVTLALSNNALGQARSGTCSAQQVLTWFLGMPGRCYGSSWLEEVAPHFRNESQSLLFKVPINHLKSILLCLLFLGSLPSDFSKFPWKLTDSIMETELKNASHLFSWWPKLF